MKYTLCSICLLFMSMLICPAQKPDAAALADSLSKASSPLYDTDPVRFIEMRLQAAVLYEKDGNKLWQALSYQNVAFAWEEKLNNIDSAMKYVQMAIPLWKEIKDYSGLANIMKYMGMLQGRKGNYPEAKASIGMAVTLFEQQNIPAGVAVSYFDLALVYENENKYDSCLIYLNKNKAFFASAHDTLRVFNTNNKIFSILMKTGDSAAAAAILAENAASESSATVFWQHRLDFFNLCTEYYTSVHDNQNALLFSEKYEALKSELVGKGIIVH